MTVDEGVRTVTPGRAAQELELRREEFQLAVQIGLVRTVPAGESGRRRVEHREIDRLKAAPDFPAGLRDRVRAVGTAEAAALLAITPERFTRLVRTGHLNPVRFSLNRYRAVVWTYLAEEVAEFGLLCPDLLTGRLPQRLRDRLVANEDLRPRNWRARRLGAQLRATDDPWAKAAAIAALLDPVQVAEVVDDPYERHHLDRLRPPPPPGLPLRAVAARDIGERLTRADDPDEILWHRLSLALALDEARTEREAPHPGEGVTGSERKPAPWDTAAGWDRAVRWTPPEARDAIGHLRTGASAGRTGVRGLSGPLPPGTRQRPGERPGTLGSAGSPGTSETPGATTAPRQTGPGVPLRGPVNRVPVMPLAAQEPPPVPAMPPAVPPMLPPVLPMPSAVVAPTGRLPAAERTPGRAARAGLFARFRRAREGASGRRTDRRGRKDTWP
ncbi:DUF6397 family protein [Streptomyces sp. NPDC101490]|uniref:DUF6397 family protein n=1 Tax=Streptomyces sp. NPDC101490 TaxID=3366143 RepID=UPI0037F99F71